MYVGFHEIVGDGAASNVAPVAAAGIVPVRGRDRVTQMPGWLRELMGGEGCADMQVLLDQNELQEMLAGEGWPAEEEGGGGLGV